MSIEVSVSGDPIQASVTESGASVSVSPLSVAASVGAGIGPQGEQGPALIASINGQTGTVVLTSTSVSAASAVHGHVIGDVTGLQSELDGKASSASTNVIRVETLNGISGTLSIAAGSNVAVSTAGSTITIAATGEVVSVNGKTGTIVLASADVSAASAVHTHVSTEISDFAAAVAAAAPQPTLTITGGSTSPLILELIQQVTT